MRVYGFDEKVMEVVRMVQPEGDVEALVSRDFAKVWCASVDVVSNDFNEPESIDHWPGFTDNHGTLTYKLDRQVSGFTILIPNRQDTSGGYHALDAGRVLR